MNIYIRSFWLSFGGMALIAFGSLHIWWSCRLAQMPARPSFPITGEEYVTYYEHSGSTSHYIYRHGLFGLRKRMQESDVLLLGSSHVELGLSAALLSRELSKTAGRPILVYNLGTEEGEALSFATKVLAANGIEHKASIVDLYQPWGENMSVSGRSADESSRWNAYTSVGKVWLKVCEDWLFDAWLPNFQILVNSDQSTIIPVRSLKSLAIRRWDTGDMVEVWKPEIGGVYANTPPHWNVPYTRDGPVHGDHAKGQLTAKMIAELKERDIRTIYTDVPYDSDYLNKIPDIAQPYVVIPSTNLTLIDRMHLNRSSRDIATEALFEGIKNGGYLSVWNLGSSH